MLKRGSNVTGRSAFGKTLTIPINSNRDLFLTAKKNSLKLKRKRLYRSQVKPIWSGCANQNGSNRTRSSHFECEENGRKGKIAIGTQFLKNYKKSD
jgi:hypothetical protein